MGKFDKPYRTIEWFEIRDEDGVLIRRFDYLDMAEKYVTSGETITRITVTRENYVPEPAPF